MTASRDVLPSAYIEAALQNECRTVSGTPAGKGLRNRLLNSAAFNLGRLVPGGLDETLAIDRLVAAARANGYASEHGGVATLAVVRSESMRAKQSRVDEHRAISVTKIQGRVSDPIMSCSFQAPRLYGIGCCYCISAVTQCFTDLPTQTAGTKFVAGGDEGPARQADELRRHFYRRDNMGVRCKIKRGMAALSIGTG